MGDRRKRKPAWDEDETKHSSGMSEHSSWIGKDRRSSHGSGHYHEVPESRTSGTRESRDNSEWPAWESIEEHPIAAISSSFKNNARNGKEFGGGKRYSKEMSPGLDGMELRNYNDARDYDQSHSQRYRGRGRSRSRSLSRGRESERRRGYIRSRSRSRNDVKANDQTRSRSPISSRLSYGWGDRRGVPEKSSQICRDFSAGSCRRGSQCYFSHPNTTIRRDRDLLEDEPTESVRGRMDYNHISKHSHSRASSGFESRNDVSDPYHEDRRAATCKDFLRGMCRWGDSCRFSHRAASDDGFDKGKSGKPICKFFAAGNCSRENCRFSHDNPSNERRISESRTHDKSKMWGSGPTWDDESKTSDFNDMGGDVTERRSRDSIKLWDSGPTWDDVAKTSDINERRGTVSESRSHDRSKLWDGGQTWDESNKISDNNDRRGDVTDNRSRDNSNLWNDGPAWDDAPKTSDMMPFCDSDNRQTDDRGDGSRENENKRWGIAESGNYGRKMGFAEPVAKDKTPNKQEHLISYGSQLQDHDGIANVDGQNALQENPSLSVNALQQNIYPASQIQKQNSIVIENNQMSSFGSGVFDQIKETNSHPIPFSGNQNVGNIYPGHSSISSESDRVQNLLLPNPPSNGFYADLNEPNTQVVNPLNVQSHTQNDQIVSQSTVFLEANVPQLLANLLNKNISDQVTNSRSFTNEHPQTHAEIPSFPANSGWAPHVNLSSVQPNPAVVSFDLNSVGTEQNCQIPPKKLSLLSPKVGPVELDSSKTRQDGIVENLEVADGNKAVGDGIKDVEKNKLPETQNGHEKVDEGGANKDEKGMRLFKNHLVEFVKEILKPTWKEGRMSRDDHKTVVKKVVEKVSSTIHVDHIPKTQEKVDQYLACSKPKISKLVQAYVERSKKKDS